MNPIRFTWVVALVFGGLLSCSGLQTGMQTPGYRIPRSMRAVVVRVHGVAGILRGMRVDVLVTDDSIGTTDPHTTTVLEGVEVLASEKVKTHGGGIVTLLTSPKDAEKLTLASQQGRTRLVPARQRAKVSRIR